MTMYFLRINPDHVVYEAIESSTPLSNHDLMEVNEALYLLAFEGLSQGISYKYLDGDIIEMTRNVDADKLASLTQLRTLYQNHMVGFTYNGLGTPVIVNSTDLQFMMLASQMQHTQPFFLISGEGLTMYQVNQLLRDMLNYRAQLTSTYFMYERLITNAKTVSDVEKHVLAFQKHIGGV